MEDSPWLSPLLDTRSLCEQRAFPLGGAGFAPCSCCCQSVVYSLHHLLLEVLPCHSFPQHVLPCWTPTPIQFLLARACAFTAVVLSSHAIFFLSLSSHPLQWENHNKSLQLEAQTYQRIQEKIQERVMNNLGTWIDWQYLQNAAKLLAKVGSCVLFGTEENTCQNAKFVTPSMEGNLRVVVLWDSTSGLGHELSKKKHLEVTSVKSYSTIHRPAQVLPRKVEEILLRTVHLLGGSFLAYSDHVNVIVLTSKTETPVLFSLFFSYSSTVSLHSAVHISICLLHGVWSQKEAGKMFCSFLLITFGL